MVLLKLSLKRLGARPKNILNATLPRFTFHTARTLLSNLAIAGNEGLPKQADLLPAKEFSNPPIESSSEQTLSVHVKDANPALDLCTSKIESYLAEGNIDAAVEQLGVLLESSAEAESLMQKLVTTFLMAEETDPYKPIAALQVLAKRRFFYDQFESKLQWKAFMAEVLNVSVSSHLFAALQDFGLGFKNIIQATTKCLDVPGLDKTIPTILNQIQDQHKQTAFNIAICSLGMGASKSLYAQFSSQLLQAMLDQQLQPTPEAVSCVIGHQLNNLSKEDPNMESKISKAIELYRYSQRHIPNLSQRTYIELIAAINLQLTMKPKYGEDLADIALDIIAQESILPFHTASYLLQAMEAIANGSSNPLLKFDSPISAEKSSPAGIYKLWKKVLQNKSTAPEKHLEVILHCYVRSANNFSQVISTINMLLHDYRVYCPSVEPPKGSMLSYFGLLESSKSSDRLLEDIYEKRRDPDVGLFNFLLRFETSTGNNQGALVWFKRVILARDSPLVPDTDSWCIGINASLRVDKISDTKHFIETILKSNDKAPLTERQYLAVLLGLRPFLSGKHTALPDFTRDLPEWANATTHFVLDHMDRTFYAGAKDKVYTAALKNFATYTSYHQSTDAAKSYRNLMLAFHQRINVPSIVPDASLFTFIFNIFGKKYDSGPPGTLADMEELYCYMIDSGVDLKPHTFISLFHSLASFDDQQVALAYFSRLIELRASKRIKYATGWGQVFEVFFMNILVNLERLTPMLNDMRAFGVRPDSELFHNLIARYAQSRPSLEDLKQLMTLIRTNFPQTRKTPSDSEMKHKLLVKICTTLYKAGGVEEVSKAVDYIIPCMSNFTQANLPPSFHWRIINMAFGTKYNTNVEVGLDWFERLASLAPSSASASGCRSVLEMLHRLPPPLLKG
ncbi:hypothetical protein DSO57_1000097 [Entomophthora muscae]|uniref:Uncharacterized protein n=1 Tax=Entomophthora muscae TaxID=34485 RepID=A0ACC2SMF1_9FUNG|nr:hypothetical protein DSO57_1000097 [Entomophthora muscae]